MKFITVLFFSILTWGRERAHIYNPCDSLKVQPLFSSVEQKVEQKIRKDNEIQNIQIPESLKTDFPNIADLNSKQDTVRYNAFTTLTKKIFRPEIEKLIRTIMAKDPYSIIQHQAVMSLRYCWKKIDAAELPQNFFYHAGIISPTQEGFKNQLLKARELLDNKLACQCGRAELADAALLLAFFGTPDDKSPLVEASTCKNEYVRTTAAYALYNLGDFQAAYRTLEKMKSDKDIDPHYLKVTTGLIDAAKNRTDFNGVKECF